jgi:simple sugar transport system permease protein
MRSGDRHTVEAAQRCAPVSSAALLAPAAAGYPPLTVYAEMVRTSFGDSIGFSDTLASATPLILTGLTAALAFRVGL